MPSGRARATRSLVAWLVRIMRVDVWRSAAIGLALISLALGAVALRPSFAQRAPAPGEPLVVAAARQIGIRRCMMAVDAVSRRVTKGAIKQDILMDWDRARPDTGPLFAMTGMSDGARFALFTLSAAATPEGGCSLLAERVGVEKSTCGAFAASTLAGYQKAPLIDGIMVYFSAGRPGETFTLTDAGTNCLVVRRQPIFNAAGAR